MEAAKLFSIIIPTFNYGKYLSRTLDSILLDPVDDYEIIIIDDGSRDGTAFIVEDYVRKHGQKIQYFYHANQGVAAARNKGINNAVGAYLIFLDADDELLPSTFAFWRNQIKNYPEMDFLVGGYNTQFPDGKIKQKAPGNISTNPLKNFQAYMQQKLFLPNGANIIKREVFSKLRFASQLPSMYDETFYSSLLLSYRGISFSEAVLKVHRHYDSLRHSHEHIIASHNLFNQFLMIPDSFSPALQKRIQNQFIARCLLALFRSCYLNGEKHIAQHYYHQVIRAYPPDALRWSYLRKYIRVLVGRVPAAG